MKKILDNSVAESRFNLPKTVNNLIKSFSNDLTTTYLRLKNSPIHDLIDYTINGLVRTAFLIELVKDDVTSTKYEVRWSNRLIGDPRFATFEECLEIFDYLMKELETYLTMCSQYLNLFHQYPMLPYELPLDYINRSDEGEKIHLRQNIKWFFDDKILNALKLMSFVLDKKTNPENELFKKILKDKIQVKTYLTDRALTGINKTNREKRWETHPNSVQFALRRDCIEIERTLILQLCMFKNAPEILVKNLKNAKLLPQTFEFYRCPITGDIFSFDEFKTTIINPEHGKSNFQVGHLNPLKATNNDPTFGHNAKNISWLSADGNRIQGHLTLQEVNNLLIRIFKNRSLC
ncbi:MAG: hypothetical protein QXM86_00120 [Candidatus Bathyarchaeia archaeon]